MIGALKSDVLTFFPSKSIRYIYLSWAVTCPFLSNKEWTTIYVTAVSMDMQLSHISTLATRSSICVIIIAE